MDTAHHKPVSYIHNLTKNQPFSPTFTRNESLKDPLSQTHLNPKYLPVSLAPTSKTISLGTVKKLQKLYGSTLKAMVHPKPPINDAPPLVLRQKNHEPKVASPLQANHRKHHASCTTLDKYTTSAAIINKEPEILKKSGPLILDASGSYIKNLQIGTVHASDQKLIRKYFAKLNTKTRIEGNNEEIGKLFEDFFEDFGIYMPHYDELFVAMKKLAHSLRKNTGENKRYLLSPQPISPGVRVGKVFFPQNVSVESGDGTSFRKMSIPGPITRKIVRISGLGEHKCSLASESPLPADQRKPKVEKMRPTDITKLMYMKGRNSTDQLPHCALTEDLNGDKKKRIVIPKLKLHAIKEDSPKDFNEEFNSKIDEFSQSWRNDIQLTRTFNK